MARETRQPKKIRYTSAEWSTVVQRARQSGRPPARYVREASLVGAPRTRRGQETDEVVHQLGCIGTTLASLAEATHVNGNGGHSQFEAVLTELLTTVRRLT